MHGCALEDRHYNLGRAISRDYPGHDPTCDYEISVDVEDAAIKKQSREFDNGRCGGVKYFDQNETLERD